MMGSAVVARSALGRKSGSTVLCICDGRVWHIMKKKKKNMAFPPRCSGGPHLGYGTAALASWVGIKHTMEAQIFWDPHYYPGGEPPTLEIQYVIWLECICQGTRPAADGEQESTWKWLLHSFKVQCFPREDEKHGYSTGMISTFTGVMLVAFWKSFYIWGMFNRPSHSFAVTVGSSTQSPSA